MHAIAYGVCANTVRESALKADSERKIPLPQFLGLEPASVLRLAFRYDALLTAPHGTARYMFNI